MVRGNALSLAWQEHPPIRAVFGTPKVGVTPFVSGRPATGSDIAQYHTYQVLACAGGQWRGPAMPVFGASTSAQRTDWLHYTTLARRLSTLVTPGLLPCNTSVICVIVNRPTLMQHNPPSVA